MTKSIKATANQSKKTFTIRCYENGVMYAKYRTMQLSQAEFNSEEMNTSNDWEQFLSTDGYYKV
tara:strand:- start:104 stop:295 length:192 start_codon:yes stop_codon:yes gene_type:complete